MYEKEKYEYVGKGRPRMDAKQQVTGQISYVQDMYIRDMCYGKCVFSTEHHAKIISIDTSEAEKYPGVVAVATAKDVFYNLYGVRFDDTPVLAEKKVRYKGEMVAAVAAETYDAACRAAELIKIEYERLPAVFDPRDAMKEGAPIIHDESPVQGTIYKDNFIIDMNTNSVVLKLRRGDIEEGFRQSDVIIRKKFSTSVQKPMAIEPWCTIVKPEGPDGITIWTTNQVVFGNAPMIANSLGLPLSKVRVISPAVGGGFGEKNQIGTEPVCALLARMSGKPVKLELTTEEHLMWSGTKHPMYLTYEVGAKSDGTLMAMKREAITGASAYGSVAVLITEKVVYWGAGPYNVPNQYCDAYVVSTNRQMGSAMRGFGMAQPTFAIETLMDMLAEKLNIDPLEIRKKNMFKDGDHMATGQAVRAVGIGMCLDKVVELSGWGK